MLLEVERMCFCLKMTSIFHTSQSDLLKLGLWESSFIPLLTHISFKEVLPGVSQIHPFIFIPTASILHSFPGPLQTRLWAPPGAFVVPRTLLLIVFIWPCCDYLFSYLFSYLSTSFWAPRIVAFNFTVPASSKGLSHCVHLTNE